MLRYLENEFSPKKGRRPPQPPQDYDEEEEKQGSMLTPGYKLRRDLLGDGERLDTLEGDDDDDDINDDGTRLTGATDKIEVNLEDVPDDEDNESLLGQKNNSSLLGGPTSGVTGLF